MAFRFVSNSVTQTINSGTGATQVAFDAVNATYGNRPTITLTGDTWNVDANTGYRVFVKGSANNDGHYTIYEQESTTIISLVSNTEHNATLSDETDGTPNSEIIVMVNTRGLKSDVGANGHIKAASAYYQRKFIPWWYGTNYGFSAGGWWNTPDGTSSIDKFPYASAVSDAYNVGDITPATGAYFAPGGAAQSAITYGYGYITNLYRPANSPLTSAHSDMIARFPFASDGDAVDTIANLSQGMYACAGIQDADYGYTMGGEQQPGVPQSLVNRFPFSSPTTNASDIGNLSVSARGRGSACSQTDGYSLFGLSEPSTYYDIIEKFLFAASSLKNTDVGNLITPASQGSHSLQSEEYGYVCATGIPPTTDTSIQRFPFAADATNASDIGDLAQEHLDAAGHSHSVYGYISGGWDPTVPPIGANTDLMQRFPFASGSPSGVDVGDLPQVTRSAGGYTS